MAITPLHDSAPAGAVGAACAELDSVSETLWSARTDEELVGGVEELQQLQAKSAALQAELLAELDARETPRKKLHWGSTADWFTHLAGTTRRAGKRTVVHAKKLTGERRATLNALWAGAVSPDQAHVILDAIGQLPKADHVRRRGEQALLAEAGRLNATDLARVGRHLGRVVDPDRDERQAEKDMDREDRAAHLDRGLSVTENGFGGGRLRGNGRWRTSPPCARRCSPSPSQHPRPTPRRRGPVWTSRTPVTTVPGCGTP